MNRDISECYTQQYGFNLGKHHQVPYLDDMSVRNVY